MSASSNPPAGRTLLVRNARLLVTMDAERREIADGAVFIRDNVIELVGASSALPQDADEVIDAGSHLNYAPMSMR